MAVAIIITSLLVKDTMHLTHQKSTPFFFFQVILLSQLLVPEKEAKTNMKNNTVPEEGWVQAIKGECDMMYPLQWGVQLRCHYWVYKMERLLSNSVGTRAIEKNYLTQAWCIQLDKVRGQG